ncbi:amidohydrolase family protein [Candidatus Hydrogenedentota bacterium]
MGLEYTEENAAVIGSAIKRLIGKNARASYSKVIHDRANVRWLIKDSINVPENTADDLYPPEFVRFNGLLSIRSRADIVARERQWKRSIHSVSELVTGLNESISSCLATGKVTCFKIGIPYVRSLAFTEPSLHEAEVAFGRMMNVTTGTTIDRGAPLGGVVQQSRVSAEELRPLQDYLVHEYVRRAETEDVAVQVHTGYLAGNYSNLCNIRTMEMVPFIMRYPRVRFDLFHAGWPYTEEHAVIGKEFPNVWLNLCWAWAMNPVTAENALDSWLASVPHKKIFGYGGDTGSPICEYGFAQQARIGIGRVLEKWIDRGDMTIKDAKEVATDIMLRNGCRFHNLPE